MHALDIQNVTYSYDGRTNVLQNIDLTLRQGELLCLLGVSGGGKTTLFNVIAGLCRPQQGRVLLQGEDITGKTGKISYMLQKDMLLPFRTVEDNVALPLLIQGVKKKEARRRVGEHFAQFGLDGTQKRYPAELSGGMRQRAALLRTYLMDNDVVLLDEPFSALDAITRVELRRWFAGMVRELGLSALVITHDVDEAIDLGSRVYVFDGMPRKGIVSRIVGEVDVRGEGPAAAKAALEGYLGL